jgi:hypothetical protein
MFVSMVAQLFDWAKATESESGQQQRAKKEQRLFFILSRTHPVKAP